MKTQPSSHIHTDEPSLEGKSVLVTGGTTGNGHAIAALLAEEGAKVCIFGRHQDVLDRALDRLRQINPHVTGLVADQSRAADLDRVFALVEREFGALDVLVNNASVEAGALTEGSDADWRYRLESDLLGYVDCTRRAVARMQDRGGHIVNIGSIVAEHTNAGSSLYVAAKSAIRGFSRALRKEVAKQNIKVSLIEPGMIGTEFFGADEEESDPTYQQAEEARGTMLKPQDIAVAVNYCLRQPARCSISLLQIEPLRPD
jgi:NADP-dependent 3-hydroxy acid dehydrogenase YdfG